MTSPSGFIGTEAHWIAALCEEVKRLRLEVERRGMALDAALSLLGRAEWGGYSCPSHSLIVTEERNAVIGQIREALKL